MNLFRSEEHARNWSLYYRTSDDYIMPVSEWASLMSGPVMRNRLDADYLANADTYNAEYNHALKEHGRALPAPDRVVSTVLITDIVNSTGMLSSMGDNEWNKLLDRHNELVRAEIERWRGTEVSTAGDSFFAVFDGAGRAVYAAEAMINSLKTLGIKIRAGVHTGEVELVDGRPSGTAVHIGSRISSLAAASEVLVSRTVKEAVTGSGMSFDERGTHQLKGVPGEWLLFASRHD
jgi:class 3 adenylate cyclase